jgi:hypothetical protein
MSENIDHSVEPGHGNSPAAWTTVTIILAAFTVGTLFFWFDIPAVVIASAVVAALAPLVGLAMKRAGYGVGGAKTKSH